MESPVQSLWIGSELSKLEALSIKSFIENGESYHLYVYEPVSNIPDGVVICDANEILSSQYIFIYRDHNSYAGFADVFRYKLLYDKGGWWFDTDVICLNELPKTSEYYFSSERRRVKDSNSSVFPGNCVIKAPRGSDIMNYCFSYSISQDLNKLKWGDCGPRLVESAIARFDVGKYLGKYTDFCPIDWWNWESLYSGECKLDNLSNSFGIHFWNEMSRRSNWDKNVRYNKESVFEKLKSMHSL